MVRDPYARAHLTLKIVTTLLINDPPTNTVVVNSGELSFHRPVTGHELASLKAII